MANQYIALLRAINVGGNNKVPMKDLVGTFERFGHQHVKTYIQSGNVVFDSKHQNEAELVVALQQAIVADFGISVPVIVRNADEWRRTFECNPFLTAGIDPSQLHVGFLSAVPKDPNTLDPNRSPFDTFALVSRALYLHLPNGTAKSKLTNVYLEKKLGVSITLRHWNTVKQLHQMLELHTTGSD